MSAWKYRFAFEEDALKNEVERIFKENNQDLTNYPFDDNLYNSCSSNFSDPNQIAFCMLQEMQKQYNQNQPAQDMQRQLMENIMNKLGPKGFGEKSVRGSIMRHYNECSQYSSDPNKIESCLISKIKEDRRNRIDYEAKQKGEKLNPFEGVARGITNFQNIWNLPDVTR